MTHVRESFEKKARIFSQQGLVRLWVSRCHGKHSITPKMTYLTPDSEINFPRRPLYNDELFLKPRGLGPEPKSEHDSLWSSFLNARACHFFGARAQALAQCTKAVAIASKCYQRGEKLARFLITAEQASQVFISNLPCHQSQASLAS